MFWEFLFLLARCFGKVSLFWVRFSCPETSCISSASVPGMRGVNAHLLGGGGGLSQVCVSPAGRLKFRRQLIQLLVKHDLKLHVE